MRKLPKYENRVVAFIDILGFKNKIDETVLDKKDNSPRIKVIVDAFNSIRDVWDLDKKSWNGMRKVKTSKKVTTFSDSIVISFLQNETSQIFFSLHELQWVIMRLISYGFLCRGAITYGKLIHNNKMIFGPALNEAYILETKAAIYPRIILSQDIINLAGKFKSSHHSPEQEMDYVKDLLLLDKDGMHYIDYFKAAQSELDDPFYDFPNYLRDIYDIINEGLLTSDDKIKIKYLWMKEKMNDVIRINRNQQWIHSLRKSGEDDMADFYEYIAEL